uniref:Uncharacterized protein n=1 Tax=Hyaloperonospora arabidopsidis (strain Emoy2) TaxID=559515 RepID=M4BPF6_HYAAE
MQLRESSALHDIGSLFTLFYRAGNECCIAGTKRTSHDNSTVLTRSLTQVETEGRTRPISVFLDGNGLTDTGVVDSAAATFFTNRSFSLRVRPVENSVGLLRKNVAGSPRNPTYCAEWFSHFRQRGDRKSTDIVLLQETRVVTVEAQSLDNLYCTTSGFNAGNKCGVTMRTETETRRGGRVAILLNPYSSIA